MVMRRWLSMGVLAIAAALTGTTWGVSSALVAAGNPPGTAAAPATIEAQNPATIRGLKWLTEKDLSRPAPDAMTPRFMTEGMSYTTAVASLQNNGFTTVALRVANDQDLPNTSPAMLAQRDAEVVRIMRALNRRE